MEFAEYRRHDATALAALVRIGEVSAIELLGIALARAMVRRPEVFYRIFTENMMAYALGRRVEFFDQPATRQITRDAAKEDYRLSAFILGVVESPAFRSSRAGSTGTSVGGAISVQAGCP